MLTALNQNKKSFVAPLLSRSELDEIRKEDLTCPSCRQPVLLKAGKIKIPHFAHLAKSTCKFGSKESIEHLEGKLILFKWLQAQEIPARLEYFIPSIQQRIDILVKWNNQFYGLEYQCSKIPYEQLRERSEGMMSLGITPIWIFGMKFLNRKRNSHLGLTSLLQTSIIHFPEVASSRIFFLNSLMKDFQIFYPKARLNHTAFGGFIQKPITNLSFPELFSLENNHSVNYSFTWLNWKKSLRTKPPFAMTELEYNFMKYLYFRQLHPQNLPSIIGLPSINSWHYLQPDYIWQSAFIIDYYTKIPVGESFTYQEAYRSVAKYFQEKLTTVYPSPSIHPLYSYLLLLEELCYVKSTNRSTFKKCKQVLFPKTLDQALLFDQNLMYLLNKLRS
ncbi:competence protein CoiA [Halalkalibacillus halophilus]|uniref:competence protein CoiA n=1 Tax=Halalkalibacillus halophilus TaxID=392827 RepID=UPI000406B3CA|nr:competence protein CoiA family protein [Halalkalibacillus halophilus]